MLFALRLSGAALLVAATLAAIDSNEFRDFDHDADGRLSRLEVAIDGELAARFSRLDTDDSGYLSREELRAERSAISTDADEQ